jgi:hypothetical protein
MTNCYHYLWWPLRLQPHTRSWQNRCVLGGLPLVLTKLVIVEICPQINYMKLIAIARSNFSLYFSFSQLLVLQYSGIHAYISWYGAPWCPGTMLQIRIFCLQLCIPRVYIPKIHIPNSYIPKICIPKIHIPKICIPKIHIPRIHIPNIYIPEIRIYTYFYIP